MISKNVGFTLVELLIVIAISAILVALAIPNYQESVRKTRRADAQKDLMKFAGTAERNFSADNSYDNVDSEDEGKPNGISDSAHYVYTVAAGTSSFTITATPPSGSAQAADKCKVMTLTNTGAKTNTGADGSNCNWD